MIVSGVSPVASRAAPTVNPILRVASGGWYSTLLSQESSWCLISTGSNQTLYLGSTLNLTVTNLTAVSGSHCTTWTHHSGVAALLYNSSTLVQVTLENVNNTTKSSDLKYDESDFSSAEIPVYGTNFDPVVISMRFTPENSTTYSLSWTLLCCACSDGCGGGGPGSGVTNSTSSGTGSCYGSSPTAYWWDSVCFGKGYPYSYAHPYNAYYGILYSKDWSWSGRQLWHHQINSNLAQLISNAGPVVMGAAIGAALGAGAGPVGAAAGAVVGGLIGAILVYVYGASFLDEGNSIWFWVNLGFLSAFGSIPWYVAWYGPNAAGLWVWSHLSYLRVSCQTYVNRLGVSGP
jgi:hypothetical protein